MDRTGLLRYVEPSVVDFIKETIKLRNEKGCDDAFFVADLDEINSKYKRWNSLLPGVRPFYAVKCNPDITILKSMVDIGFCFDCASKNEIKTVLSLGATPDRIVDSNPHRNLSHITFMKDNEISLLVVDSEEELKKIKNIFPRARILIRICSGGISNALQNFDDKFGCEVNEAQRLMEIAKRFNLEVIGISFHVGWCCQEPQAYSFSIKQAKMLFTSGKLIGHDMRILDIGGGFLDTTFDKVAAIVNESVDDFLQDHAAVRVIAEPGTFIVQKALTLVMCITGKTLKFGPNRKMKYHYYFNDGSFGSFGGYKDESYKKDGPIGPFTLTPKENQPVFSSKLWGPTCDADDVIADDVLLPEMDVGEWVFYVNAGAYTLSFQTDFNGMSRSKCVFQCKNRQTSYIGTLSNESLEIENGVTV